MKSKTYLLCAAMVFADALPTMAADGLNAGDTAWMIVSTALVMMMTPAGLALFYGDMCRYKNLLNTYAMTLVAYCLASVVWMM
jgi:Amt family ammonium transporter